MKHDIFELFTTTLQQLELPTSDLKVTRPENPHHGTYTTNIAFLLGKKLKRNPLELAQQIIDSIKQHTEKNSIIESITVAGPGFINVTLTTHSLINHLHQSHESEPSNKRLIIEYTQPNPFKEMHIGHLYSNAVGESLARLHEATGWTVRRVNYQGDVGMHVAKSLYGLLQIKGEKSTQDYLNELSSQTLDERINILGKAYAAGSQAFETDNTKDEIKRLNVMAFIAAQRLHKEQSHMEPVINYTNLLETMPEIHHTYNQEDIFKLYKQGRAWSLEYFETRYKLLGTTFDDYYFESKIAETGYKIVKDHIADGIFEEHEGAIVYRGENDGLHTRVFINSLGLPVYEAKDLGLAPTKYQDWPYDRSIVETGKEIDEYFKVILSVLRKIRPDLAEKTVHLSHGMVRLPEGKMSSRTGNVKTADWLLESVKDAVHNVMEKSKDNFTTEEYKHVLNVLTVATIKYSLLRVSLPADISFDIEKSVSLDGDSGPYLIYTYARCQSVLKKTPNDKLQIPNVNTEEIHTEEKEVLRHLLYFKEYIEEAATTYSPSTITRYLTDLAQLYNAFYAKYHILPSESDTEVTPEQSAFRVFLTTKTAEIVKYGLQLLGIETVEKM